MNPEPVGCQNGYWMPTIVVDDEPSFDREKLLMVFKENNIDGRVFFWPLSMLPMFEGNKKNINSYALCERAFNLPSYHDLSQADVDRVVNHVRDHFGEATAQQ